MEIILKEIYKSQSHKTQKLNWPNGCCLVTGLGYDVSGGKSDKQGTRQHKGALFPVQFCPPPFYSCGAVRQRLKPSAEKPE